MSGRREKVNITDRALGQAVNLQFQAVSYHEQLYESEQAGLYSSLNAGI